MNGETPEGPQIWRCDCHSKHVQKFTDTDRRMDNMQKLFYIALGLIAAAMGWLVIQNTSMSNAMTRMETMHINMTKTDERLEAGLMKLTEKIDKHINDWRTKNGKDKDDS